MPNAVEFKGGTVTLMTLHMHSLDLSAVQSALGDRVGQAPNFFRDAPVVLDFSHFSDETSADSDALDAVFAAVREQGLQPIASRARGALYEALAGKVPLLRALDADRELAEHLGVGRRGDDEPRGMTVDRVVRSGQQVYSARGDLVVIGSSGAGSELIADGNIHVYGALRGRAICGINGNQQARIFCRELEAELVSVAGTYKLFEELPEQWKGIPAQISLYDQQLHISSL